ncbi:MAG: hypothetical protein E6Y31_16155, partial [Clostridium perfringens]|nr:hypothetical protein [Clostridium perfringens]
IMFLEDKYREIKQSAQVIDNRRYIIIEAQFKEDWRVLIDTRRTVNREEADEIDRYWLKYKQISPEQILVVEVPNILRR